MSLEQKAKAAAQNIQGKITEAVGNVTGDVDTQVAGQVQQAEAELSQITEDQKDEAKNENIDVVSDD
ncbi:MAG TPA: CsbD family protein [Coleofasciculaceae cyanobacterium]|jgi:uncharacterized protein YjbJ (UPF0337 family)